MQDAHTRSTALSSLTDEISLPTWAPEGFTLGSVVQVSYFGERLTPAYFTWHGDGTLLGAIGLTVSQPVDWVVDLDHLEEVDVNGEPAGLTRGNWDADSGQWTSGYHANLEARQCDVSIKFAERVRRGLDPNG